MEEVPMLEILTVLIMAMAAYAHSREGLFGAVMTLVNVVLAGFLAFNLWEFLIKLLTLSPGGVMDRYADSFLLVLLFCVFLGIFRLITLNVVPSDIVMHPLLRQIGGGFVGLITGYILSGIMFCMFQTLPWHENFLWYNPEKGIGLGGPERVWLAMMHKASGQVFDWGEASWFDADGSFIPRYARYRRFNDQRETGMKNEAEFPSVLSTTKREPLQKSGP